MKRVLLFCLVVVCLFISKQTFAQPINDEARVHFNRGLAATEGAKSAEGYKEAIQEFEKAKNLAPFWPDVYYNLGLLYEKIEDYDNASRNLKIYLLGLLPNAPDQDKIRQAIDVLEFKKEKSEKLQRLIKILCDPKAEWVSTTNRVYNRKSRE